MTGRLRRLSPHATGAVSLAVLLSLAPEAAATASASLPDAIGTGHAAVLILPLIAMWGIHVRRRLGR